MLRWLWNFLYGSTPAEFRSAYALAESVERLRAATKRSVFAAMGETTAVGKVSERSVRLQRVIPMVGNSFKPFFIGHFELRDGEVVLAGKFTMLPLVKAFMTVWFGMVALGGLATLLGGWVKGGNAGLFIVQPFLMFGAGLALVAAGKWFARNDAAWLSRLIERALAAPEPAGSGVPDTIGAQDRSAVPITLKGMALFLTASGVMAVVSGLTLTGLFRGSPPPAALPPIPTLGRWSFACAAFEIALAIGVWHRRPWAWRGVFALLGLSACWSIYAMDAMTGVGPPAAIKVAFAALSCVVVAFWGRWWYAQRRHFR
jgi:hypothetical protein